MIVAPPLLPSVQLTVTWLVPAVRLKAGAAGTVIGAIGMALASADCAPSPAVFTADRR